MDCSRTPTRDPETWLDLAPEASQAMARPGRAAVQRQATLRADDLVVQSSGFLNTFHGRAWVPSLVPAGFDAATLR